MTYAKRSWRWGILGSGFMAWEMTQALRQVDGAEPYAVTSRDPEGLTELASRLGIPRVHESNEALLSDPNVDVVYVATPNSTHADLCVQALEAGKPVLCEKPFTTSAEEAERVIAAARRTGRFCMEGLWTRLLPWSQRLTELVAAGALGELRSVEATLAYGVSRRASGVHRPDLGGGALLHLGVYPLELALRLMGSEVRVESRALLSDSGVDEHVSLLLEGGGALGTLSVGIGGEGLNRATVVGTRGRIEIPAALLAADHLRFVPFAEPGEPRRRGRLRGSALGFRAESLVRKAVAPVRRYLGSKVHPTPIEGSGYRYEVQEVLRCLREGRTESPALPLDDTLARARVIDRARACWVDDQPGARSARRSAAAP